ncbi:hypothetical protein [Azospirillum brasilense]|uniref:Uncharacterized protein n=1 Tax=Azospirillum brasilense TaxID=192 RepID=A0A6L3AQY0_AZOBR|nr:hypothetical protein [Azospirillum brasilense]KAA0676233.1 hypothetical protein DS837_31210 [Azospirillum brasilense]
MYRGVLSVLVRRIRGEAMVLAIALLAGALHAQPAHAFQAPLGEGEVLHDIPSPLAGEMDAPADVLARTLERTNTSGQNANFNPDSYHGFIHETMLADAMTAELKGTGARVELPSPPETFMGADVDLKVTAPDGSVRRYQVKDYAAPNLGELLKRLTRGDYASLDGVIINPEAYDALLDLAKSKGIDPASIRPTLLKSPISGVATRTIARNINELYDIKWNGSGRVEVSPKPGASAERLALLRSVVGKYNAATMAALKDEVMAPAQVLKQVRLAFRSADAAGVEGTIQKATTVLKNLPYVRAVVVTVVAGVLVAEVVMEDDPSQDITVRAEAALKVLAKEGVLTVVGTAGGVFGGALAGAAAGAAAGALCGPGAPPCAVALGIVGGITGAVLGGFGASYAVEYMIEDGAVLVARAVSP